MRIIMDDASIEQVNFVHGDITDEVRFEEVVREQGITHILHLAALQVPFVRANPVLGSGVNVVGTAIVFETARKLVDQVQGSPTPRRLPCMVRPISIPGTTCRRRAADPGHALWGHQGGQRGLGGHLLAGLRGAQRGVRPFFVYGPGRDQGVSSTPTKAMAAAAMGGLYTISFGGTDTYQHADDVARVFIQAARTMPAERRSITSGGRWHRWPTSSPLSNARHRRARARSPLTRSRCSPPTASKARRSRNSWVRSPGDPSTKAFETRSTHSDRRQRRPVRRRAGDCLSAAATEGRMRLRNIFAASRFIIGLAVLGSFVGSAILLVIATITLFRIAWNEIVNFDPDNLGDATSTVSPSS